MKLSEHADHSERLVGLRGEDIHQWIDGLFDVEGFDQLLRSGRTPDFDPYDHRKYRHCQEALADAIEAFSGKYTPKQVRAVFECHVRGDYGGYLPSREDFENGTFKEKYHESEAQAQRERILDPAELTEYFSGRAYSRKVSDEVKDSNYFRLRIVLPTAIAIVLFVTSVFAFVIPVFRSSMLEHKKEMIRELTAAAASMIAHSAQQQREGKLSAAQAKKLAADQIAAMRYGGSGKDYFWITDMHPRMVMHPYRPDLVGKDLTHYSDTKGESGKRLFVDSVRIVRDQGSGYMEYMWQWMDDPSRMAPKLSYVQGIPAWGWIIGTGVYIDDVQREIDRLTRNLMLIFAAIGAVLVLVLLSVVWQSRRIEDERQRAEAGLLEAKERYRALVEASQEGYILDIGGVTIYSNRTLQRMLGLSEEELAARKSWDLLSPGAQNEKARQRLVELAEEGEARAGSFEAQLSGPSGETVDVIVSIAKIFFSQKNGHVVSFRPVKRTRVRSLLETFVGTGTQPEDRAGVLEELQRAESTGQVVQALNRLSLLVREMAEQGVRPGPLRQLIGEAFDGAARSLLRLAVAEFGEPPVPFAFLSLGSNSRHEMTMFSDQDNAIVFQDVDAGQQEQTTRYFLKLADRVCAGLNEAGYPYCPGGVMAVNPKWCLPLAEWKACLSGWAESATPDAILELNVFADIACIDGEQTLVDQLHAHIHACTGQNTAFFMQFARNCLLYKVPVELLGKVRADKRPSLAINIKECLKPVEIFVRLYALKHAIAEPSTVGRLRLLAAQGALAQEVVDEIVYVFDYLWRMRFYNQLFSHADLKQVNDRLELSMLTEVERQNLRNVLARIAAHQEKLCAPFLGMPRHMLPLS